MDYNHIRTISISDNNSIVNEQLETFVQKASFSAEVGVNVNKSSAPELQDILGKARSSRGGTFAQRARAAELQAARALKESDTATEETQSDTSIHQRTTLTLKMPRRRKWTPLIVEDKIESSANDLQTESDALDLADQQYDEETQTPGTARTHQESMQGETGRLSSQKSVQHRQRRNKTQVPSGGTSIHRVRSPPGLSAARGTHASNEIPARSNARIFQQSTNEYPAASQYQVENPLLGPQGRRFSNPFSEDPNGSYIYNDDGTRSMTPFATYDNSIRDVPPFSGNNLGHLVLNNNLPVPYNTQPINRPYPAVRGTPMAMSNSGQTASSLGQTRYGLLNSPDQTYNSTPLQGYGFLPEVPLSNTTSLVEYPDHPLVNHRNSGDSLAFSNPTVFQNGHHQNGDRSPQLSSAMDYDTQEYAEDRSRFIEAARELARTGRSCGRTVALPLHMQESWRSEERLPWAARRAQEEEQLKEWWTRDVRAPREMLRLQTLGLAERATHVQEATEADRSAEGEDDRPPQSTVPQPTQEHDDMNRLLVSGLANLFSYQNDRSSNNPFSPPPSWTIDHTPGGNTSFFSQQWGQPPQRVGRDPRYRALQHNARSSVFEDPTGRRPREEYIHDRGRTSHRWSAF